MKNIKNYTSFLESYSEDVKHFIQEEKNFALFKGDELIYGFDEIEETFKYLANLLLKEKQIDEAEKDEFISISKQILSSKEDNTQSNIDNTLEELLDRFNIIEPFYIKLKFELEDTPIDTSLDTISEKE